MSEPIPDVPDVVAARALVALVELIHTDPVARPLLTSRFGMRPWCSVSQGSLRLAVPEGPAAEQLAAVRTLFDVTGEEVESHLSDLERHRLSTTWRGVPLQIDVDAPREDEVATLQKRVAELTAELATVRAMEGALAEQRHQLYDPAVPPLAARQPAAVGEAL
jgi:hypothetical protein